MSASLTYASDIAFTPSVKAVQSARGSRSIYERMEQAASWATSITPDLKAFVEAQTSVFLATANREGQPYIQHRGGPAGFLRVLDDKAIGFADFAGNRQYITVGNLRDNPKAHLFLIDYVNRQRIKIWGEASSKTMQISPRPSRASATKRGSNASFSSPCPRGTQTARSTFRNGWMPRT